MDKVIKLIVVVVGFLALGYFILRGVASWKQGYSWKEMDWDQKGNTTIADFLAASDIEKREVNVNGQVCTEYFAYKDGLSIRTDCQK